MDRLAREALPVFDFLRGVWDAFPTVIKWLILGCFGGVIYISVLKSIWR